MEEILASIRRIIADDQAHLTPLSLSDSISENMDHEMGSITFEAGAFEAVTIEEPIARQDAPSAIPPKAERAETTAPKPDVKLDAKPARTQSISSATAETQSVPPVQKPKTQRSAEKAVTEQAETLLSSEAGASATSAFESLSSVVLSKSPRTLDDLVQDMLRPLLKSWLDENLPPLVEKLVRAEIERISGKNR